MFGKAFWKGAAERAIKTAAQSLLGVLGVGGIGVLDVDWQAATSVALVAALASVLTSISNPDFVAGAPELEVYGLDDLTQGDGLGDEYDYTV